MEQTVYFAAAMLLNVPFGMYRARLRKLSVAWFVAIHLPIPLIVLLRMSLDISPWWIPLGLVGAVIGQVVGSRLAPASWRAIGERLNAQRDGANSAAGAQSA